MTDHQGILVCGELAGGKPTKMTRELISTGRKLCEKSNHALNLLFIGQGILVAAQKAVLFGAERVYTAEESPFLESLPERFVQIISHVCEEIKPAMVLFGQTDIGRELAPRMAARLDTGVCLDCFGIEIDPDREGAFLQSKPVYGGNAVAVWASAGPLPLFVTMRPRSTDPAELDPSRKGEVIPVSVEAENSSIKGKLLESVKEEVKGVKLAEAKVIVSGGGGIGGSEGFGLIHDLARVLGGAVGISRVPCDEGWMPSNLEIGQTGHVVSPDLYVAVGISGAPQHMAGCSGAKCIVAVNRDPDANIFKEADLGIIGDYREVLPELVEKCKNLL